MLQRLSSFDRDILVTILQRLSPSGRNILVTKMYVQITKTKRKLFNTKHNIINRQPYSEIFRFLIYTSVQYINPSMQGKENDDS